MAVPPALFMFMFYGPALKVYTVVRDSTRKTESAGFRQCDIRLYRFFVPYRNCENIAFFHTAFSQGSHRFLSLKPMKLVPDTFIIVRFPVI
jgi:hypothetical protein